MVIALACAALAAAIGIAPGPTAVARLATLRPAPTRIRSWRPGGGVAALLGGLAGVLVAGPAGALAGALVAATVRRQRARHRAATAAVTAASELADAVSRITEELRAGSHPAAALDAVQVDGPAAREILAPAAAAARLGAGVAAALRLHRDDRPETAADVERIAVAWSLADRHGIPLTELLAGAQDDIRWRIRFGSTVRAHLAGPRATAVVLSGLPLLGIGLGQLVGADPIAVLRGGVLGQVLLVLGVALVAAGVAWSEHILRSAVPR